MLCNSVMRREVEVLVPYLIQDRDSGGKAKLGIST